MGYASSNLALSTILFWQCSIAANAAPSYGEDRVFESHHCYHSALVTQLDRVSDFYSECRGSNPSERAIK